MSDFLEKITKVMLDEVRLRIDIDHVVDRLYKDIDKMMDDGEWAYAKNEAVNMAQTMIAKSVSETFLKQKEAQIIQAMNVDDIAKMCQLQMSKNIAKF